MQIVVTKDVQIFQSKSQIFSFLKMTILLRLARVLPFLSELAQWSYFMRAVTVMKRPYFGLVFTMYSIYYLYTIIGMYIYGGLVTPKMFDEVVALNPDTEIGHTYMWLNFNDFPSGLLTLFSMMLGNNWQFIWAQFNFAIDGDDGTTDTFFFSYIGLTQYVLINILMAFVIDVYTSIETSVRHEKEEK